MEADRIKFIEERDGPEAALAFAVQTLKIYKQCLNRKATKIYFARGLEYRRTFIESIVFFRKYIRGK